MHKTPVNPEDKLTETIEDLDASVDELDSSVEDLDDNIGSLIKSMGYGPSFIRGITGAVGAAIGATVVLGLIIFILQKLAGFPFIGEFIKTLLHQLQQNT